MKVHKKKNIKVLVIDRGYLEPCCLYEEQFVSFLGIELENFEERINDFYKGKRISVNYDIISIMRDITNNKAFSFISDEKGLKKLKYDYYSKLGQEFPDYITRYSTDCIKCNTGKMICNGLNVFVVYTESKEELEMINRHYYIKAILKFEEQGTYEQEDNFKRIYINSIPQTLKVVKEMPLFLFYDIEELHPYFINL